VSGCGAKRDHGRSFSPMSGAVFPRSPTTLAVRRYGTGSWPRGAEFPVSTAFRWTSWRRLYRPEKEDGTGPLRHAARPGPVLDRLESALADAQIERSSLTMARGYGAGDSPGRASPGPHPAVDAILLEPGFSYDEEFRRTKRHRDGRIEGKGDPARGLRLRSTSRRGAPSLYGQVMSCAGEWGRPSETVERRLGRGHRPHHQAPPDAKTCWMAGPWPGGGRRRSSQRSCAAEQRNGGRRSSASSWPQPGGPPTRPGPERTDIVMANGEPGPTFRLTGTDLHNLRRRRPGT